MLRRNLPLLILFLLVVAGCKKTIDVNEAGKYACITKADCIGGKECRADEHGKRRCFKPTKLPPDADDGCQLITPPPEDACSNAQDRPIVEGFPSVTGITVDCINKIGNIDDPELLTCCMKNESNLSNGCASCFGFSGACMLRNCATACGITPGKVTADPDGQACRACLAQKGCDTTFTKCAGL